MPAISHDENSEHPVMEQVRFLRDLADRVEAIPPDTGHADAYRLRTISYALEFMFTASMDKEVSVPENVRINAVDEKGRRVKPSDPAWDDFKKKPK